MTINVSIQKIVLVAMIAVLGQVTADSARPYGGAEYDERSNAPNYNFGWQVRSGGPDAYGYKHDSAEYGHQESRYGDRTEGQYTVQLPDGRLKTVDYIVDGDSGFLAKVTYEGLSNSYDEAGQNLPDQDSR